MHANHDCIVYGNSLGRCGLCHRVLKRPATLERERDAALWAGQFMAVVGGMKPNPIAEYGPQLVEGFTQQRARR